MGVRWLIAPEGIAPEFGLILDDGLGLSSQIGDMSGYFLFLGISILLVSSRDIVPGFMQRPFSCRSRLWGALLLG